MKTSMACLSFLLGGWYKHKFESLENDALVFQVLVMQMQRKH